MTELSLIAGSALVWLVTQGVKKLRAIELSANRKTIIRLIVAVGSFAAAIGASLLNGADVDPASVEAFVNALVVFLGSQGVHLLSKDTEK